ncbi:hypothetical protein [Krasilnikovia sp. M28-CT-15]|uniref:hypothetical protein n=1 Tax=Krasilnikovia sp. M28-CT-15 TaxID=3373540 RepID=UPI003876D405
MAPPDRIRPDSALATEPDLAAALDAELRALEAVAASGDKRDKLALANALDTWSLLASLPWQRLNYRWGRWQAEQTGWKALISFEAWESYHWQHDDDRFQVIDPHSGQRLGEFYAQSQLRKFDGKVYERPEAIMQPGGTLEFAGNPATIGVYRPPGGGADSIRFTWNPWLNNGVLRDGIAALRSGSADSLPPPYQFVDLDLLDKYRIWCIDQPDKPGTKAPFASEARLYRPGGPPRFGRSR